MIIIKRARGKTKNTFLYLSIIILSAHQQT
jgi:hypothetical protein